VAGCALPGTAKIKNGIAFGANCLLLHFYFIIKNLKFLSFRAERGISLFFSPNKGEIPRFARNDKKEILPQFT